MRNFHEYTRANYKSDIWEMFGNEGIPGNYPQYVALVDIAADAGFMAATKWKRALELYDKLILSLREDRKQVFRLMIGQISEQSKSTIRETESGATAMLEEDPLLLLRAIILTHLSNPRLGADQNLLRFQMAYETVRMDATTFLNSTTNGSRH